MYKKTITYTDYNGNQRTEDLYFNLSKAELAEMNQIGSEGSMQKRIEELQANPDSGETIKLFKDLILAAYGQKSDDGRTFLKYDMDGHKLSNQFVQTEAYSELFMAIASDEKELTKFMQGIMPQDLMADVDLNKVIEETKNQQRNIPAPPVR